MAEEIKKTLIEEGTEVKGTVSSSRPVIVMGRVEGELTGPSVEVTESGVLRGKAKVTELRSRGELAGDFDADVVELSGTVRDKTAIRARSLEVRLERRDDRVEVVFGDCELVVGDAPDKAKAIAEAQAKPAAVEPPAAAPPAVEAPPPAEAPAPAVAVAAETPATSVPATVIDQPSGKNGVAPAPEATAP